MRKKFIQNGEKKFIEAVVQSVLKRDLSKIHILIDDRNVYRYLSYPVEQQIDDIRREDGTSVKILCVISKELIEDFHSKAGHDDLSKPWIKKAVKHVIDIGKEKAKEIYS
ncbi:hypothetical protein [Alkalihalobacterium bogoriense]|uniref:hypothetical protein n=1 Tax=Alkalihalobacterium bogoriense TaxID=246272 RepID=UPI0004799107|nr:hypothetical protein [Alkalihalobacterium bogoriense]